MRTESRNRRRHQYLAAGACLGAMILPMTVSAALDSAAADRKAPLSTGWLTLGRVESSPRLVPEQRSSWRNLWGLVEIREKRRKTRVPPTEPDLEDPVIEVSSSDIEETAESPDSDDVAP